MVRPLGENWLEVEQIGDVTIARFTARHLLDEQKMQAISRQLRSLGEEAGHRPLVLNFGQVERLSTELMGKLVALQNRVQQKGGRLALCKIHPQVYEVFKILKLPQVFSIFTDEQEALQHF
ncbi:MAG TPA: STAS domain-containing protein [Gemmataceae bacterium]|nr:STAS domain-containing protein [Gemmataceae bacterium]